MTLKNTTLNKDALAGEFEYFGKEFTSGMSDFINDISLATKLNEYFHTVSQVRLDKLSDVNSGEILLDFDDETARSIIAVYNYIHDSFKTQFSVIVKNEKDARQALGRVKKKRVPVSLLGLGKSPKYTSCEIPSILNAEVLMLNPSGSFTWNLLPNPI